MKTQKRETLNDTLFAKIDKFFWGVKLILMVSNCKLFNCKMIHIPCSPQCTPKEVINKVSFISKRANAPFYLP